MKPRISRVLFVLALLGALVAPRALRADPEIDPSCNNVLDPSEIRASFADGALVVGLARDYLQAAIAGNGPHEIYDRWFGDWEFVDDTPLAGTGRPVRETVMQNLVTLRSAMLSERYVIECNDPSLRCYAPDQPKTYAYRRQEEEPLRFYLCADNYAALPEVGHLSRRAVWIHESSHAAFQAKDVGTPSQRNEAGAMAKAKESPRSAAANAYSYTYFVEDAAACGCRVGGRAPAPISLLAPLGLVGMLLVRRFRRMPPNAAARLGLAVFALFGGTACVVAKARETKPWQEPPPDPRFSCKVTGPALVRAGDPVPIEVTIANRTDHPLRFVEPFREAPLGDEFSVYRDRKPVCRDEEAFFVTESKTIPANEYRSLAPGEAWTGGRDLARQYTFRPGHYIVIWFDFLSDVIEEAGKLQRRKTKEQEPTSLKSCNPVQFDVVARDGGTGDSPDGGSGAANL